jgi:nucleoside-diphosphate-sugar epimerase
LVSIILFGSSYIAASILKQILYLKDSKITVIDRKDPHYILNMDVNQSLKTLASSVSDIFKNVNYKDGFMVHPNDSLSFLFINPITDSVHLFEEMSKLSPDIVIDASMVSDPLYCENNIQDTVNINTFMPTCIFSILKNMQAPKLYINLSSGIVYGPQQQTDFPIKEDSLPNPIGMRAASLLARESIVAGLAKALDIPFITLRLGNAIGYYTPFEDVINQFVKSHLQNKPLVIQGDGSQARDFFDIRNLGSLVFKIISQATSQSIVEGKGLMLKGVDYIESIKNEVYNIGGYKTQGEDIFHLITLDRLITTALGKVEIPKELGKITIKTSKVRNVDWRYDFEKNLKIQMDISKAINKLGYDPEYNLIETIKTQVIPYVATNILDYTEEEMDDLKKNMHL